MGLWMAMNIDRVRRHFEDEASSYDGIIDRLIPGYHEQHEVILRLIPFKNDAQFRALDLGSGTGALSHLILKFFPKASVCAFDIAENMLEVCKTRLTAFLDRLSLVRGDFAVDDIGSCYDVIVSGLAIHHLAHEKKKELFRRIFRALNPGGILFIRDAVRGATPALTGLYERLWREFMRSNGEDDSTWFEKYRNEDIPASIEDQTAWLRDAGFIDVACHWRHLNFAVFGGRKP
jgi:tRNA (cmo5U34)-methyltransferase